MWETKPFVPCDILGFCILLFVHDGMAAVVIGLPSIDEESGLNTYPDSSRADEVWKDPDTCKSTGAAKYDIWAWVCTKLVLKQQTLLEINYADHFLKPSEDMDEQLSFLAGVEVNVHSSRSSEPS